MTSVKRPQVELSLFLNDATTIARPQTHRDLVKSVLKYSTAAPGTALLYRVLYGLGKPTSAVSSSLDYDLGELAVDEIHALYEGKTLTLGWAIVSKSSIRCILQMFSPGVCPLRAAAGPKHEFRPLSERTRGELLLAYDGLRLMKKAGNVAAPLKPATIFASGSAFRHASDDERSEIIRVVRAGKAGRANVVPLTAFEVSKLTGKREARGKG
jgi:hypothetical protein